MESINNTGDNSPMNHVFNHQEDTTNIEKKEEQAQQVAKPAATQTADTAAQAAIQNAALTQDALKDAIREVLKETASKEPAPAPATPAKAALILKNISRKDVDKKDHALVKTHIPSRITDVKWDTTRNVVVVNKSGKERVYGIGRGALPALFESSKHKDVIAFLNKM